MSRFELVPLDGGAPVQLPPGETPLGRGPLLAISDKRVSRRHAVLDVTRGQLRLKSTHVNPCFLQSSLDDDPRPLDRDCWVSLSPGDFLSLLPGRFVYRVAAVGGASDSLRVVPSPGEPSGSGSGPGRSPGRARVLEEEPSSAGTGEEAGMSETTPVSGGKRVSADQMSPPGGAGSRPGLPAREKRVLPAWMMKAVSPPTSEPPAVKKRKEPAVASKKATPTSSPVEAGLSEQKEERPRKKPRISGESPQTVSPMTLGHDDVAAAAAEEGWAVVIDRRADRESANGETVPARVSARKPAASAADVRLRTACPYGSSCYRKNPAHFQECSHPGDPDFQEEEEEVDEAQLPECPYGTDCYRKNPLHRKEFRHSRRPARSSRTVSRNRVGDDDDDEDDEDQYESSFIDDSDDGDGDSDYVPAGSDDDGEDVMRLQSEARDFLKKRK
ncbi:aprataxin and PNK-like factor [Synchiropus picturatus]